MYEDRMQNYDPEVHEKYLMCSKAHFRLLLAGLNYTKLYT